MSNYSTNVSRYGQINATGSDSALFLTQFSGEVLTEFEQANKLKERCYMRSITNGKTAQ